MGAASGVLAVPCRHLPPPARTTQSGSTPVRVLAVLRQPLHEAARAALRAVLAVAGVPARQGRVLRGSSAVRAVAPGLGSPASRRWRQRRPLVAGYSRRARAAGSRASGSATGGSWATAQSWRPAAAWHSREARIRYCSLRVKAPSSPWGRARRAARPAGSGRRLSSRSRAGRSPSCRARLTACAPSADRGRESGAGRTRDLAAAARLSVSVLVQCALPRAPARRPVCPSHPAPANRSSRRCPPLRAPPVSSRFC